MVSIDTNIQAVKDKRFIWGHRDRWLNDTHIDTGNMHSQIGSEGVKKGHMGVE